MIVKTICPQDCPNRHAGCGSVCEKFLAYKEDKMRMYARKAEQRKVNEIIAKSVSESYRKMNKKQPKL